MTHRFSSASSIAPTRVAAIRPSGSTMTVKGYFGGVHHALRKPKELPTLRIVQARIHELSVLLEGTCLADRHVRTDPHHPQPLAPQFLVHPGEPRTLRTARATP